MIADEKKIEEFFESIAEIPNKSLGGCLFFCYAFFRWLQENQYDVHDFTIHHIENGCRSYLEKNLAFVRGESDEATSAWHFVWTYNDQTYDCNGEYTKTGVDLFPRHHAFEKFGTRDAAISAFCVASLNNLDEWNPMFDRRKNIELTSNNLMIDFSEIQHQGSEYDEE